MSRNKGKAKDQGSDSHDILKAQARLKSRNQGSKSEVLQTNGKKVRGGLEKMAFRKCVDWLTIEGRQNRY